ncbi:MAG: hypothetical protein JNJ73_14605 [Hyphomonadaceae bacterium]|nr:hypothetical protein [Hyphomonadaceae bacterium]
MNLMHFVFGASPRRTPPPSLPVISRAPPGAIWRNVRARPGRPVRARLAESDGVLERARGPLRYRGGDDYIVEYGPDDAAIVKRSVFQRTYARRDDGLHEKRTDIVYRCFTLSYPVAVRTLEGLQHAAPGDWIMEGVDGELWPVRVADARNKYEPA